MSNSDKVAWDTQELPQGDAKAKVVQNMFDAIAPRYDLVNRIMTFRLDTRWRKIAVRKLALTRGARVLDLASGTGDLCVNLRKAGLHPLSFDMSFGMLAADHSNAPRVQADILRLPIATESVDGVTCGFALRNLVDLNVFFHEIARVTKSGGRIALLDVSTPTNPLIRWATACTSEKSCHGLADCFLIVPPTTTCRKAWRTCQRLLNLLTCCNLPALNMFDTSNSLVD